MILPLRAHGRFLGAMTLASNTPERRFGAADLAAAEELARRAALAIDNARLYREAKEAIRLRDELPVRRFARAQHADRLAEAGVPDVREADDVPPAAEVFDRMMNIISRQSQRLATLVSDMLDVAQIPAGSFNLHREPVDLASLVRETVELSRGDLERARVSPGGQGRARAWWDTGIGRASARWWPTCCRTPSSLRPARRSRSPSRSGDPGRARLIVEDHGMGIPPERLPHIFGRFERAVSASHYGGLGLGLYIVHAVVEAHGRKRERDQRAR